MKSMFKRMLVLANVVALSLTCVHAQESSALVDELVKKGVLSDQEAEDVRAKITKEWASSPASKIVISNYIKSIKFYGDVRLRFEDRQGKFDGAGTEPATYTVGTTTVRTNSQSGTQNLDRWRYRFRVGVDVELYNNLYAGFALATNPTNDRSGNVTFGRDDNTGSNAGAFGKGTAGTPSINKIFIGWHATPDINLVAGQFDNPFYTTNLLWDDNINPAGISEQYLHKFGALTVFANAGQLIYAANNTNGNTDAFNNTGGRVEPFVGNTNTYLWDEQAGVKYNFTDDMAIKAAVGFMSYSGSTDQPGNTTNAIGSLPTDYSGAYTGVSGVYYKGAALAQNNYGINNLEVLEIPAEFDFKALHTPFRVFGDFAVNLDAQARADAAQNQVRPGGTLSTNVAATDTVYSPANYSPYVLALNRSNGGQDKAYQVGIQAGVLKKKGDWIAKAYWQHTEYFSIDNNLNDADIFDARTNLQGFVLQGSYAFTDAVNIRLTYANANPIVNDLATPGTGKDLTANPIKQYQLLQADLLWKF